MKGSLAALLGGVGASVGIGAVWQIRQGHAKQLEPIRRAGREIAKGAREIGQAAGQVAQRVADIDLNNAEREELLALPGITDELADRIIENRPYRNKLDLVARLVIPEDIYQAIKEMIHIDGADEAVKVA